jgi:hypothetical protein
VSLIEVVAAVLLVGTSGLILAMVWLADRQTPPAPLETAQAEQEPEYRRAA